jgi:SH3-like domain-containing protein
MRDRAGRSVRRILGRTVAGLVVISVAAGAALLAMQGQRAAASAMDADATDAAVPGAAVGKSGLPVPRFVSLKAGRVNVRGGPGDDYKVAWVFTKKALPVEVVAEFDTWRRVRDSDGTVGWVFHSLLSNKRTVVVSPWAKGDPVPIHARAANDAAVTAYLQPGVLAAVDKCRDNWCSLSGTGFSGWIEEARLWGVYPGEAVD